MIGTWVSGFFFIFLIGTMSVLFFKITVPQVPSWWKRTNPSIPQQPASLFKLGTNLFTLLQDLAISCEWFLCFREHDKKVCCLRLTSLLSLPADQLPAEALGLVFKAALGTKIKLQVSLSLSLSHSLSLYIYIVGGSTRECTHDIQAQSLRSQTILPPLTYIHLH